MLLSIHWHLWSLLVSNHGNRYSGCGGYRSPKLNQKVLANRSTCQKNPKESNRNFSFVVIEKHEYLGPRRLHISSRWPGIKHQKFRKWAKCEHNHQWFHPQCGGNFLDLHIDWNVWSFLGHCSTLESTSMHHPCLDAPIESSVLHTTQLNCCQWIIFPNS